jgi:predicted small secreted protein
MKTVSIFAAVLLCLLAGCASQQNTTSGTGRKFEAGDDFKIEAVVYGYLLEKHPWADGDYAAIFLAGSNDRTAALIRKFPHHVPPLKTGKRAQLRPNQAPIDKNTGKPGLILSASAVDPSNGVSEAVGTWYAGEGESGLYAFVLVETDGQWTIQSVK